MKKGDIVTIYQDPISCTTIEGKAKLIRQLSYELNGCEHWIVNFISDKKGFDFARWVNLKNH